MFSKTLRYLPILNECEIRSFKVLDTEIKRIKNHFWSLIEQTKKERDKKIQESGGYNKCKCYNY